MSYISFHSKEKTVEVSGSERAYMALFCNSFLLASLGSFEDIEHERYGKILPPSCHVRSSMHTPLFWKAFESYMLVGGRLVHPTFQSSLPATTVAMNTVLVAGSDPARLLARLHGQCERYCWVEAQNRNWLADIIECGRSSSILRANMGWEAAIDLLRSSNTGPAVCSYSAGMSFPYCAYDDPDEWEEMADAQRWTFAMQELRKTPYLELKPETWETFRYGAGITGYDLRTFI